MKLSLSVIAGSSLFLLGLVTAAPKEEKARGVLAPLEKGTKVSLKEAGQGYEIGLLKDDVELGYTVKEVGADYIVVEDITKVTEVRIPIYSIKAVTVLWPKKKDD